LPAGFPVGGRRPAVEEELAGLRAVDPTEYDRTAVRLDRFGSGMAKHVDSLTGG
jgi:hypothetical protein